MSVVGLALGQPPQRCTWTGDDDGCWSTGCGQAFELTEGPPSENSMRFCCYCGQELEEQPWTERVDEDEEAEDVHD